MNLTLTELKFVHDVLLRRRMYRKMDCPLGNPWSPFMEDLLTKVDQELALND